VPVIRTDYAMHRTDAIQTGTAVSDEIKGARRS
jgi:hypothetical protein